jgi:hypothetical protein
MDSAGFEYFIQELDGYNLVVSLCPEVIDERKLAITTSVYYGLIEESDTHPFVCMTDVSRIRELADTARDVLMFILRRNMARPGYLCSAWVVGTNAYIDGRIRDVLTAAGRPTDTIFETRDQALDYLRGRIRTARDARAQGANP